MTISTISAEPRFESEDYETDVDPLPPAVGPDTSSRSEREGQTIQTFVSNQSTDGV